MDTQSHVVHDMAMFEFPANHDIWYRYILYGLFGVSVASNRCVIETCMNRS